MQFGSDVTLTQDIGIPILVTGAKIGNSIGRPHTIDNLSVALTSPSGNSVNLIPIYMKPLLSQFMLLPIRPIPVPVGSNMEMAIFWGSHQQEVVSYMNQIPAKMTFHPSDFCTRVKAHESPHFQMTP
jgi:hypothetical protein